MPRADELEPGKIFFLTSRAVGRVLDLRKDGGNLLVTLGPVGLTDIIREAHKRWLSILGRPCHPLN